MGFNIGDKVTPKKDCENKTLHKHGETFEVKSVENSDTGYGGVGFLILTNEEEVNQHNWEVVEQKETKTMVNYHVLNDSIVLNYNRKTVVVASDDKRYAAVLACIKGGNLDDIPSIVEVERGFQGSGIELRDGLLYEGDRPFPTELSDRIIKFKDQGIPYAPLFAFWDRLKKNPSYNARQALFKFLEHNGHPLTQDGLFIAYRGVADDFTDKRTGKFNNSPGSVCEMARDLVDDNPNNTCSSGLHVACFDYAKGFGERLVEVKVDPQDVVAVPTDYDGTKMRVCKFEVIQECANIREELVYGQPLKSESDDESDDEEENNDEDLCKTDGCEEHTDDCSEHCQECGEDVDGFGNFCPQCGNEV